MAATVGRMPGPADIVLRAPGPRIPTATARGTRAAVSSRVIHKRRGGSEKGRTQVKKPKGYQARRRAAVLYQYEANSRELDAMPVIPDVPVGAPKRGEPGHIARRIAKVRLSIFLPPSLRLRPSVGF